MKPKQKLVPLWAKIVVFVLTLIYKQVFVNFKRADIPEHLLGHPVVYQEDLIHPKIAKELNEILRELGSDETGFPSNAGQAGSDVTLEHIGDAQDPLPNG